MLQRHELEIHKLHPRPHIPILNNRSLVRRLQLLLDRRALHPCHRRQEYKHVGWREDELVHGDAGYDCRGAGGRVADNYVTLEEGVPGCGSGAEDGCEGGKVS